MDFRVFWSLKPALRAFRGREVRLRRARGHRHPGGEQGAGWYCTEEPLCHCLVQYLNGDPIECELVNLKRIQENNSDAQNMLIKVRLCLEK